jgi:hypothetical protein
MPTSGNGPSDDGDGPRGVLRDLFHPVSMRGRHLVSVRRVGLILLKKGIARGIPSVDYAGRKNDRGRIPGEPTGSPDADHHRFRGDTVSLKPGPSAPSPGCYHQHREECFASPFPWETDDGEFLAVGVGSGPSICRRAHRSPGRRGRIDQKCAWAWCWPAPRPSAFERTTGEASASPVRHFVGGNDHASAHKAGALGSP